MNIVFKEMRICDLTDLASLYMETFNASPWYDQWTKETAEKRLHQMIHTEGFYGLCAYEGDCLCGAILGCMEQFYNGVMFNVREFWVKNGMRGNGIGTAIFKEFESRLRSKGVNEIILFTAKGEDTEHFYMKQNMQANNHMVFMGKKL